MAPRGRHFAFEPLPRLAADLRERFPSVEIVECALGDVTGTASFEYVRNAPGYSGLRPRRYDVANPDIERITVRTDTLDNVIPKGVNVAFIKINVEGGEYHAIVGGLSTIRRGTPEFGSGFETWLFHELLVWRDYLSGASLEHWRSTSGLEVDFLIDGRIAVGAKAADNVSPQDLRGLRAIQEEGRIARRYCVCLEPRRRRVDGIDIVPAVEFITELWEELG